MKKLYHKGAIHPSPPIISDHLSFLPATILILTVALSPQDKEVLAYLISCSSAGAVPVTFGNPRRSSNKSSVAKVAVDGGDHAPLFNCSCFRCYTSYWVRWDESPNRQLIHEIIDAFEDWLAHSNNKGGKKGKGKKEKKRNNKKGYNGHSGELKPTELMNSGNTESGESESAAESGGGEAGNGVADEKGSVIRFVSFIGEKIWGGWGQ